MQIKTRVAPSEHKETLFFTVKVTVEYIVQKDFGVSILGDDIQKLSGSNPWQPTVGSPAWSMGEGMDKAVSICPFQPQPFPILWLCVLDAK